MATTYLLTECSWITIGDRETQILEWVGQYFPPWRLSDRSTDTNHRGNGEVEFGIHIDC